MEEGESNDTVSDRSAQSQPLIATSETLELFHDDVKYLWTTSEIPVYDEPPSSLEFLRNHVAVSRPCIIRNAILNESSGRPLTLTLDDFVENFSQLKLQVDVTPDGHGDCLRKVAMPTEEGASCTEPVFVKPMEMELPIVDFCHHLRAGRAKQVQNDDEKKTLQRLDQIRDQIFPYADKRNDDYVKTGAVVSLDDCVLYYSRQNDCLRKEMDPLWNWKSPFDEGSTSNVFPRSIEWAEQAFTGTNRGHTHRGPDAVNLWMGDERAVSAMHKDHYENLFYVLSGEKVFSLCPPADAPFLYERQVVSGQFQSRISQPGRSDAAPSWSVTIDTVDQSEEMPPSSNAPRKNYAKVHWIAADPFRQHAHRDHPLLRYAHPMPNVRVRAGEMLYLPSLWFHRVTQTCETVGINYWYDMCFNSPLWCYFHLLQQLQVDPNHNGDDNE
ncbi:cupin-like domain containing protein [Nitzschia inconspicua]|uniref:Cupin-like domain containing protein n=1 Tax=Nitzschia inconspicua TaxID=303405 RepID=A0A9K3KZ11_9STRA|nr:cupin-like domain containing protein [Nitzschia inconspicua]